MGKHNVSGYTQWYYSIREQKGKTLKVGRFARARPGESALHAVLYALVQLNRVFPLEVTVVATGKFTTYRVVFGYYARAQDFENPPAFEESTAFIDIEDNGFCKGHK